MRILIAALAGLAMAACGELPQDGPKPFVAAKEFKTDGAALAERTAHQDEYPRTGAARR